MEHVPCASPKSATAFSIRNHEIEHPARVLYKRLCHLKHEHLWWLMADDAEGETLPVPTDGNFFISHTIIYC